MSYDWEKLRKEEWPVLETMTFLDAACVSFAPQRTVRAVKEFADMTARQDEANSSAHHIALDDKRHKAYVEAAKLLNADPDEIALVESTSHGLNIAAQGIELNDGNDDFVGSQAVTRQEACLYAFNTLKATMVEYSDNSTVTVGDITISSQGDYSDVSNSTSSDGNIEDDGLMQFAERYFRDLEGEDDTDDFGSPATKIGRAHV